MAWSRDLDAAFNPGAIAIVGASASNRPVAQYMAPAGLSFARSLKRFGFPGNIYPIHPTANEVLGLKAYPSLHSVPEHVDLVIVSVPAPDVAAVLEDCIAAGIKNVQVFTAGFKESGEEEGIRLEAEITSIARKGSINLIGPNCVGLCYVPRARLAVWDGLTAEPGPVSFISQSGGHTLQFTHYGQGLGIRFSKVISYGNAAILDSTDFLEYLASDPETEIICLYVEGVKDGPKLTRLVRDISPIKPVIVWKGGTGEFGKRAAASHTGSLAGEEKVWEAFFKQTGAVRANSLEELADLVLSFLYLSPPQGHRVGVILNGGGYSVWAADTCGREGLEVPTLSPETQRRLGEFIPAAGTSIKNPLDAEVLFRDVNRFDKALKLVAADPLIDMLILCIHLDILREAGEEQLKGLAGLLQDFASESTLGKPVAAILDSWGGDTLVREERQRLSTLLPELGIPVYRTLARATRVLPRFAAYHQFVRETKGADKSAEKDMQAPLEPRRAGSAQGRSWS